MKRIALIILFLLSVAPAHAGILSSVKTGDLSTRIDGILTAEPFCAKADCAIRE